MKISPNSISDNTLRTSISESSDLLKKLATAKRINSAVDDAAGLQIVDRLTSQINGSEQGIRNLYDGISLAQTAEGTLSGVTDSLQQLQTLNIQAGNGIYSASDLAALQDQANQLGQGIAEQLSRSSFAGQKLFDGGNKLSFESGSGQLQLETKDLTAEFGSAGLNYIDLSTSSGRIALQTSLESFTGLVNSNRASLGAGINSFASTINSLQEQEVNTSAARSRIEDLDYAQASADKTANDILTQSSVAITTQSRISAEKALQLLG